MTTKSSNVKIPPTILRLGESVVEKLVLHAIKSDITADTLHEVLTEECGGRQTTRALMRIVDDRDIAQLNINVDLIRSTVAIDDRIKLKTSYARGLCQVLKYDKDE